MEVEELKIGAKVIDMFYESAFGVGEVVSVAVSPVGVDVRYKLHRVFYPKSHFWTLKRPNDFWIIFR